MKYFLLALSLLLTVILDTVIIPLFYYGPLLFPLTLVLLVLIALQNGVWDGLGYGAYAGILMGIASGEPLVKMIAYTAIGVLVGFLFSQSESPLTVRKVWARFRYFATRTLILFMVLFIHEFTLLMLNYFNNALMKWFYIGDLSVRSLLQTLLILALYPLFAMLDDPRGSGHSQKRGFREVKKY